jgi:hypothetical protein
MAGSLQGNEASTDKLLFRNATPNKWKCSVEELLTNSAALELINTIHTEDFRRFNYEAVGTDPVPRYCGGGLRHN